MIFLVAAWRCDEHHGIGARALFSKGGENAMDVTTDPGAALILRAGGSQQAVGLSALKRQAKTDADVVTMAMQSVQHGSSDPNRGKHFDVRV